MTTNAKLKKFTVTLNYVQYSKGEITIEAENQEQAEELAQDVESDKVDWNPYDGNIEVMEVEVAK